MLYLSLYQRKYLDMQLHLYLSKDSGCFSLLWLYTWWLLMFFVQAWSNSKPWFLDTCSYVWCVSTQFYIWYNTHTCTPGFIRIPCWLWKPYGVCLASATHKCFCNISGHSRTSIKLYLAKFCPGLECVCLRIYMRWRSVRFVQMMAKNQKWGR